MPYRPTGDDSEYKRTRPCATLEKQRFGTIALPDCVILNPDDRVVAEFSGLTRNLAEFNDFLRKGMP